MTEEHRSTVPWRLNLHQNYPNPFNHGTTIGFDLPTRGEMSLSVYNLVGQRVANLVSGWRQVGSYTVDWNTRDDDGRQLASGVYLYRLSTEEQTATRRLLLLK